MLYTNITSGKFKGKKLALPSLKTTRSTKSIVRQSFFNVVRELLSSSCFIEGFGGSGLMACEAVSNGAKQAIAIELDKEAFALLSQNCKLLAELAPKAIKGDSFSLLGDIIKSLDSPYILYLDPPFDKRTGYADVYERCFKLVKSFDTNGLILVCFEHSSAVFMPENIGLLSKTRSKKFGATSLSYYQLL